MFLKLIVDLVLILIVAIGIFVGVKQGFIKTVAKPVKIILTFVIATSFASRFAVGAVEPRLGPALTNQIEEYILSECGDINSENLEEELPTLLKIAAGIFDVDIKDSEAESPEALVNAIVNKLTYPVVHVVSVIISFVILALLSSIILSILLWIISAIFDGGVIGVFNRILGGAVCFVLSFVTAWLLASVFTYTIHLPSVADKAWASSFEGGLIYRFFNSINPIDLLLSF